MNEGKNSKYFPKNSPFSRAVLRGVKPDTDVNLQSSEKYKIMAQTITLDLTIITEGYKILQNIL